MERFVLMNPKIMIKKNSNISYPSHSHRQVFFLLNLLYNPSKVISFLVAMKTTSGSIKTATSGKKNFGEIIILASRFHVIRQWRMVQNRPVSRVCFVPNRHQSKKSSFLLHSDLYFAACPLSKNEQLACVQTPLPSGKIYFS